MNWKKIGCIGCTILSVILIGIIVLFVFVGIDVFKNEFAPLRITPSSNKNGISITLTPNAIPDIAYIQADAIGYSDDDDPQNEGVAIDIQFYDSESEPISFSNIPMSIYIELIAFEDSMDLFETDAVGEIVYEGNVSIDHSMRIGEMLGNYIRISFDDIQVARSKYYQYGKVRIRVTIQDYIEFEDEWEPVPLYED